MGLVTYEGHVVAWHGDDVEVKWDKPRDAPSLERFYGIRLLRMEKQTVLDRLADL